MCDILKDNKFISLFLTIHPENKHIEKYLFSPNNIICVPRVLMPIMIKNNNIIKALLSIVLKTHGQNLVCGESFSRQNIVSLNLTRI